MPYLLAVTLSIDLFFLGWNMGTAVWQKHLIKQNRPIKHALWFTIYCALVVLSFVIFINPWISIVAALIRAVVFDPFLNLIRHKPFWYTNDTETDPNDSTTDDFKEAHLELTKGFYFLAIALLIVLHVILIKKSYAG